jgi:RHS repeat-associated protein
LHTHDAENRLLTSTLGGVTTAYTYDGDGRRVMKSSVSGATVYVYDAAGQLAAEYGAVTTPPPCVTCYLTADNLGSTRMVTDASGIVQSLTDYLPFGEEIQSGVGGRLSPPYPPDTLAVADGVTQKFTGKERDVETGLDFFGARYLSSAQGRFTGADAVFADQHAGDPQTWNLYLYVSNNPLRFVDPTGRGTVSDVLWGVAKGAGSFVVNNIPGYVAVKGMAAAVQDLRHPAEAMARQQATTATLKSLTTAQGWKDLGTSVANGWKKMSTSDKAATITEAGLGVATAVAGGAAAAGGAAENTTALSTFRFTSEGETFTHYGFTADSISFTGGLRPGAFAATEAGLTGSEAQSGLALPHIGAPDAAYTVSPSAGTPLFVNPVVERNFGQPGGLSEVQFPMGTAPGTVSGPTPIQQH